MLQPFFPLPPFFAHTSSQPGTACPASRAILASAGAHSLSYLATEMYVAPPLQDDGVAVTTHESLPALAVPGEEGAVSYSECVAGLTAREEDGPRRRW